MQLKTGMDKSKGSECQTVGLALAALKICPSRRPLRPRCDFLGAIMRPSDNGLDCHVETPVLS